jgi:Mn2+/Fe2+ NRAMP family transporter
MSSDKPLDPNPGIESPPTSIGGILMRLGPGLIVAGSIVGSGELIATTRTGAEAGFVLLWLIAIGCVIKVFCQVEFGRYSLVTGLTTMDGLAEVPGPRIAGRGNWIVWYWFIMWFASIGQLGGIVGGVGQALSISVPITSYGREYNEYVELKTSVPVKQAEVNRAKELLAKGTQTQEDIDRHQKALTILNQKLEDEYARWVGKLSEADYTTFNILTSSVTNLGVAKGAAERGNNADTLKAIDAEISSAEKFEARKGIVVTDIAKAWIDELKSLRNTANKGEAEATLSAINSTIANANQKLKTTVTPEPADSIIWAWVIAIVTAVMLVVGRYGLIQTFSTVMVALFTMVTVITLFMLQGNGTWAISIDEVVSGLTFSLPQGAGGKGSIATALATFGIIGVGASELITYPYWCIEKGYAKFTGKRDNSAAWGERAAGWLRVMRWDSWCSMVVYTFATIAFYLLGAATLGRSGLVPASSELIRTLSVMYEPVFGTFTQTIFLFGAFAVLYSTFFVANASHARVFSDSLRVLGLGTKGETAYRARVTLLSGFFPILCVIMYTAWPNPVMLVLISGLMQAIMLPMLAFAALYFRHYRCDDRVKPTLLWDIFLYISAAGMAIAGVWALWSAIERMM